MWLRWLDRLVLLLASYLLMASSNANEQLMSLHDAVKVAEQYQRKLGQDPSSMRVTATSDISELKALSGTDVEVLKNVTKDRPYWIVYHAIDHKKTPNIRGQAVFVVIDARSREVIFTLVK